MAAQLDQLLAQEVAALGLPAGPAIAMTDDPEPPRSIRLSNVRICVFQPIKADGDRTSLDISYLVGQPGVVTADGILFPPMKGIPDRALAIRPDAQLGFEVKKVNPGRADQVVTAPAHRPTPAAQHVRPDETGITRAAPVVVGRKSVQIVPSVLEETLNALWRILGEAAVSAEYAGVPVPVIGFVHHSPRTVAVSHPTFPAPITGHASLYASITQAGVLVFLPEQLRLHFVVA